MLCFRCERRARFLEGKPDCFRCECKDVTRSVHGCYQFVPCVPVVTAVQGKDCRPRFAAPMIAAREQAVRLAEELQPTLVMLNDTETVILYMQVSPPTVDIHDSNEPCTPEVCDACIVLKDLYEDEWRMSCDWGSSSERNEILKRCEQVLLHMGLVKGEGSVVAKNATVDKA